MTSWIEKNLIFLSLPVDKLLAITAYGEAASEGGEGMMAVLNVIRNRALNPDTFADKDILNTTGSVYHAVVLKPYQFSMYNIDDPVRKIAEDLALNFDERILTNKNLQTAYNLSLMLLSGQLADNMGGATHYHSIAVTPSWASAIPFVGQIGRHLFYSIGGETTQISSFVSENYKLILVGGLILGLTYYILKS
jgi:spore germination cell wall hydrolase CwlJ-like protein